MIDALLFDKDGTLFDFRISWGRWAAGFLAGLARDQDHANRLGRAIGFDAATLGFAPDSPVIAATAADIAAALLPHLPGMTLADLTDLIDDTAGSRPCPRRFPSGRCCPACGRGDLRLGLPPMIPRLRRVSILPRTT
jgi:phosphoglycolate phosphatase